MHASPPFQLTARHFGQSRTACGALLVLAASLWFAWAVQAVEAVPLAVMLGGVALATCGLAIRRWVVGWMPSSLRWDGQRWFFGPASTRGQEPMSGRLEVCIDLGAWMLVRFEPEGARWAGWGRQGCWLPLQRKGHELDWHALRSTVYCARPVFPPSATPF